MTVQPAHHLVLINGYTHNCPWYEEDPYLSYRDPYALADCWRNHFNNEILEDTSELWKNYHFVGNTGRISVFTNRPYSEAVNLQGINNKNPKSLMRKNPEYKAVLYCGFCNQYAKYHEHDCDYNPPWDPYDGYPFNAPSTN